MLRKLAKITTWEELESRWKKTRTEAEAIGLLHATNQFQEEGFFSPEREVLFAQKTRFLLGVPREVGEGVVADTARQVLASEGFLSGTTFVPTEDCAQAVHDILVFFGTLHTSILRPPYPRKIQEFLCRQWHWWRSVVSGMTLNYSRECEWPVLYKDVAPVARALCVWGAADMISYTGGFTKEVKEISLQEQVKISLPVLEEVATELLKNKEKWLLSSVAVSPDSDKSPIKSPSDLRNEEGLRNRNFLIARTLLWARLASKV